MKAVLHRLTPSARSSESGIALAESMVAAVIIVLVLTANAIGLLSAYNAYGSAENYAKAYQIVNKQFSYFKAAPWYSLGTAVQTANTTGCDAYADPFTGESVSQLPVANSYGYTSNSAPAPFQYCQGLLYPVDGSGPVTIYNADESASSNSGLGITFYYQTVITNVTSATFDGASSGSSYDSTTHDTPKRMTVTVRWSETDSSGNARVQTVRMSEVRTPTVGECVSPRVTDASGNPVTGTGC